MMPTTNRAGTPGQARFPSLPITFTLALLLCLGMAAPAKAQNNAAFVSQSVPATMVPGQVYAVSVTMQNTGNTTWSAANAYKLGSDNPLSNTTWGLGRVELPNDVALGQSVTFNFNATAPSTPGVYNFQWKMLREAVQWFGTSSTNVEVSVGNVNNAQFVSQSVPTSMVSNQSYAVSVTMKNNGSNAWTVGGYYLRSQNPEDNTKWGLNRVELPNAVAPGESVTFNFSVTPAVNGSTNFLWRMAQGTTSFGALTTNVSVAVSGTNNAAFVSQSVPGIMVPGQVYAVSVTMQNTGNTTWSEGNSFRLGSQNPQDNSTWGVGRVYLSGTVPPGANVTFNFNVTAPTTPGTYNFQWKMVRDGVQWFGALSANVAVAVNGTNDSQLVSQTVPATMAPSQSYPVSVTLQNTGTSTWAPGSYFLGSENPQANTTWGLNRVELTASVAPGANVTLSFSVTAPSTTGAYNFQWRMVQNSTRFGAFTTNVSVNVQQAQTMALYYVHVDHLNTPRLVANATGTTVWRWDQAEPFGSNPADENPSGLGAFDLPLRLPGQYFDKETNSHYNMMRDYDPAIGRYIQSDPIGLDGGINTYSYVGASPIGLVDPDGLEVRLICRKLTFPGNLGSWAAYGRQQKHCFVQVTCPAEGINAVLSIFGERGATPPSQGKKAKNDPRDNPASSSNPDNHAITPGNAACQQCCKYEKEVLARFEKFPSGWVTYEVTGWNSNSFAEMLVTSPSCRARIPYDKIQNTPGFGIPR